MFRRLGLSCVIVATLATAFVTPASGNGRMPASFKVVFRPGSTTDILAGVTFGLMVSRDDGATWRWMCESAVGFEGTFDPDYEFAANGTIWATTFSGLRHTSDGCDWGGVGAPLGESLVTAVEVAADNTIYAGLADPAAGTGIYKSTDGGATFVPTANLNQPFDWFDSIETAPSAPQNVYAAGYKFSAGQPALLLLYRSMNGGTSWEKLPVSAFAVTDASNLQLAAISPTNPDQVYIRVTLARATIGEAIYRTDNWSRALNLGGPTWTKVIDVPDYVTGVAVRQNGEVFATTTTMGLLKSTDGGMTFTAVPNVTFEGRCLTARPSDQSLWMCANNLPPDQMAVGRSPDGASWMSKLQYKDIVGPVRCEVGTEQRDSCEGTQWCIVAETHGASSPDIDCAADAGVDGPGGDPPKDGCCLGSASPPGAKLGLALLVLVVLMLRSRHARTESH